MWKPLFIRISLPADEFKPFGVTIDCHPDRSEAKWRDLRFLSRTRSGRENPHYSVRKAWTGLIEAARCAGITLARSAQNPSAATEPASTSGSQLFTW